MSCCIELVQVDVGLQLLNIGSNLELLNVQRDSPIIATGEALKLVQVGGGVEIVQVGQTGQQGPAGEDGGGELPITSQADLITGDATGNAVRLPAGEWGQYLTVAFYDDGGDGGKELQWNYIPIPTNIDSLTDQLVYPDPDGTVTEFSLSVVPGEIQAVSLVVHLRPAGAPVYGRLGPGDWTAVFDEAEYIIGFTTTVAPAVGDALLVDYRAEVL